VIKSAPQRVVTLGWGSTDAAIALGVYPVAIEEQTYGGDSDKMLPWVHEALDKAGRPLPTLLPSANEGTVPVEDIVRAKPDLILAPYSGITAAQFATLSKIAPVVAYPKLPWATDWNDVISITAKALGRSAGGQAILDTIDAYNAEVRAEHPEFAGMTFASVWDNPTGGGIYVYSKDDGRVQVMTELGLTIAPSVVSLYNGDGTFSFQLSYEKVDQLGSDILINYADDQKSADAFATNATTKVIPAVAAGTVVNVVGPAEISAVSPPTALSYLYAMPGLVDKIAAAVG
jgi:iron complex transport system substrate-binding protein